MNIWDENLKLEPDEIVKLIEEQFESIQVNDIFEVASGFDNNVYKVNNKYLFRLPRRDVADKLIKKEGSILPIIKPFLSIPIPNPVFYGNPTSYYPYKFLGFDYLHSFSIDEITEINSIDSIAVLAKFLSELHSIPINIVENIVGYDDLDRLNVVKRKDTLIKNTDIIKKMGICETVQLESYINCLTDIKLDDERALVHGDLHIRNLLYNKYGVVSSVIDFGDIHVGHKACDISIVFSVIPNKFRSLFFEIYGDVSQNALNFAKFRAIFTNVFIILHAYDYGNNRLVEKAILSLNNALN